jgi:hypothetical protein
MTERPVQPYQKPTPAQNEIHTVAKTSVKAIRSSGTKSPAAPTIVAPTRRPQSPFLAAFFTRRLEVFFSFIAAKNSRVVARA